jgi:hypothetical protein
MPQPTEITQFIFGRPLRTPVSFPHRVHLAVVRLLLLDHFQLFNLSWSENDPRLTDLVAEIVGSTLLLVIMPATVAPGDRNNDCSSNRDNNVRGNGMLAPLEDSKEALRSRYTSESFGPSRNTTGFITSLQWLPGRATAHSYVISRRSPQPQHRSEYRSLAVIRNIHIA